MRVPRTPALAVAALAVMAATAAGCTTVPASPGPSPTSPTPSSTPLQTPLLPGMQRAWVHGIGVDAPASWRRDDLRCGVPQANTLVVTTIGWAHATCAAREPTGISVVWIGSYQNGVRVGLPLGRLVLTAADISRLHPTVVAHLPVERAALRSPDGEPLELLVFPHRHVFVLTSSPDRTRITATVESIQSVLVDPDTGCLAYTQVYEHAASLPAHSGPLVPTGATGAHACYYVDGWLEATAQMSAADAQRLGAAIDAAPKARVSDACRLVREGRYVAPGPMALQFSYAGGHARTVVARIVACRGWASYVSDGRVTRRMTLAVLHRIPRLWGYLVPPGVH